MNWVTLFPQDTLIMLMEEKDLDGVLVLSACSDVHLFSLLVLCVQCI